jgi:hypothetical protein
VRTFHPCRRLRLRESAAPAAEFTVPIALAFLGLADGRGGLEMSEEMSESRREAPQYRTTAALALVLLFLGGLQFGIHSLQQRRTLRRIEVETSAKSVEKAAVEELSRRVTEKRARFSFLEEKVGRRIRQAALLSELTAIVPDDTYLSGYTFSGMERWRSAVSPPRPRVFSPSSMPPPSSAGPSSPPPSSPRGRTGSVSRYASTSGKAMGRKLGKREKRFLLAAGAAAVLFLSGKWFVVPFVQFESGAADRIEDKLAILKAYGSVVARKPLLLEEDRELEAALGEYGIALLPSDKPPLAAADLQTRLKELAARAGLDIVSEKILNHRTKGAFIEIPLQIVAKGSIDNLKDFIVSLEGADVLIEIEEINLRALSRRRSVRGRAQDGSSEVIQATMTIAGLISSGEKMSEGDGS